MEKNNYASTSDDALATSVDDSFAQLWRLWPNKKNKAGALRAYKRRLSSGDVTADEALRAVTNYVHSDVALRDGGKFVMHFATFFGRDERWRDELAEGDLDVVDEQDVLSNTFDLGELS